MTHWKHLTNYIKDLSSLEILDLGSGKGLFIVDATMHGAMTTGLEINQNYIKQSHNLAKKAGVHINVVSGRAESLPFKNCSFDFVNVSEVIEHVDNPVLLLKEVYRILRTEGKVYMSVPNRFGIKDQHFHLYFVNWLPRRLANIYISIFGTHKDYKNNDAGRQNLVSMHYYTYSNIKKLAESEGFEIIDIRAKRASLIFGKHFSFIAIIVYKIARTLYFDSFHLLLTRNISTLEDNI